MKLREANKNDEKELIEIYEEYINSKKIPGIRTFEGVRDFENLGKMNFKQWLEDLENNKHEENLPEDYSTHTFYLAENDKGKIVGAIGLRWKEVPVLMNYGGFIGYSVRPTERGKGYATEILKLGLHKFKEIDNKRERVLITCKDFNIASKKVIEKNNGVYESSYYNKEEGYTYLKYWIEIKEEILWKKDIKV